ncbi:hypothetical protein Dimus_022974 [Dionaea muscipula]
MASGIRVRSPDYGDELGYLLKEQRRHEVCEREKGLEINRSGSAPPTVEGSLSALGGLFGHHGDVLLAGNNDKRDVLEEELRSDPEYVNYYYSSVNWNPRLPPPLLSKEDWRSAQRLNGAVGGGGGGFGGSMIGGMGDRRKLSGGGVGGELFYPGFNGQKGENRCDLRMGQDDWSGDGLIGLPGLGFGSREKSIAEIIQDDLNHSTSFSSHFSRSPNRSVLDENTANSESQFAQLHHEIELIDVLHSSPTSAAQNAVPSALFTYASVLGASLSGSTTPDPQSIARAPSPHIPPVGVNRVNSLDRRSVNGPTSLSLASTCPNEPMDAVAALSALNLSSDHIVDENRQMRAPFLHRFSDNCAEQDFFSLRGDGNHIMQSTYLNSADSGSFRQQSIRNMGRVSFPNMGKNVGAAVDRDNLYARANGHVEHHKPSGACSPSNYHTTGSPSSAISNYSISGNNVNPALGSMMSGQLGENNLPLLFEDAPASALGVTRMDCRVVGGGLASGTNLMASEADLHNLTRAGNYSVGVAPQVPIMDPLYLQYLRSTEYAAQVAALNDLSMDGANSYVDLLPLQKAYLGTLLSSQKSEFGGPYIGKSGSLGHGYYGNHAFGLGMGYGGSPLTFLLPNSQAASDCPMRHGERNMRLSTEMRNFAAGVTGVWRSEAGVLVDQSFGSSLIEEFKSNKTKCFELSEIAGHVVEFSSDQYGSRFIQQKLEAATTEEKNMVFHEINAQALSLMTDVFGNYVVQKFFEHGTASQIRELADKLAGHVLTLTLQMYGCRVIQKAIEVVDLDQQKKMVAELDGHIMRCVRDQNGNHVIQKCIECIPEEAIQFIVSTFYDQVVMLSTHPYGCRVIQRILEHFHDPKTQQIVMDEIMQSICMLAQDQYGNYVVQHVLEHGKPHERSAIISKLTGRIVHMSQQKFASNVIEKCLTFGDPVERRTMVNEMLGSTEDNDPLQVMMKDQFANYVVQKVLETCEDQQLELILSRIKIHLNALKKYTYGKHIFARVEKLVAAGERRIGMLSGSAASMA